MQPTIYRCVSSDARHWPHLSLALLACRRNLSLSALAAGDKSSSSASLDRQRDRGDGERGRGEKKKGIKSVDLTENMLKMGQ